MAKLKLPGRVSAPDPQFSRRLEFDTAAGPQETPAASPPTSSTSSATGTVDGRKSNEAAVARTGSTRSRTAAPQPGPPPAPPRALQPRGEDMVTVRVLYRLPDELVARASAWAEKARCPTSTVLRRAMAELRPELVAALEAGIDHRDVSAERARHSAHRFDSSITLSRAAHARLCAELDPEGLAGLTPALSRWVRARAIAHLETWLARAGY